MPKFSYKAKNGLASSIEGTIDADDLNSAVRKIVQTGVDPVEIKPQRAFFSHNGRKKVRLADKVIFFKQMGDLVEADVPLLKALHLSSKQTGDARFKEALDKICADVSDGRSLSAALSAYPDIFTVMHINIVQAGEISGRLGGSLKKVAGFLEKEHDSNTKIALGLIYPSIVVAFSCLVIFILLAFVIPKIMVMYDDFDGSLPLPTVILMAVSGFIARYWWVLAGLLLAGILFFRKCLASKEGKHYIDSRIFKVPFLGMLVKDIELGRFARVLASLLDSGVVMVLALTSAEGAFENEVLRAEFRQIAESVTQGRSLSQSLTVYSSHISESEINLIMPAEAAGNVAKGLYKLADVCEHNVDLKIKTITALLEPFIILGLGLIVGFILIAALLPILNINMIIK